MKKNLLFYAVVLFCMTIISASAFALTTGDFRSIATGNWSAVGTWQTYDGSAWNDATAIPDLTQPITVTIVSGHTVTVDASYDLTSNLLTANNATLNIIVNGYLKETGIMTKTAGVWTINGTYELNHAPASGSGLPTATWNDGSTCSITGLTGATTGINASQSFYDLTYSCPNQTASLNLGWSSGTITIRRNVTVSNTGSGRLQVCGPAAGTASARTLVTVNIGGNIVVDGSNATSTGTGVIFTSNGTSNNYTDVVINVAGNVTVTGNSSANNQYTVFAISKGSQGGTGTTIWNFSGDVSVSNAIMQNSNSAGGKFIFAKSGTQTLTLSNINNPSTDKAYPINWEVSGGSTLNIGSTTLSSGSGFASSGFFTLDAGAGIMTSHASGLDGNLTNTGTKTLNTAANYGFNGSAAQVTGSLLPATVNNLIINNVAGVSLTAPATVSGILTFNAGTLSLGVNDLTIGATGSFSGAGAGKYIVTDGAGKLNIPVAAGVATLFPIGISTSSYDPVSVTPVSATNFTSKVYSTLSGATTGYSYNAREWNLTSDAPSSTVVTLTPSAINAVGANPVIGHYVSGNYVNVPATLATGSYSATFASFSPFVTGGTDLGSGVSSIKQDGVTFDGQIIHNDANLDIQVYDITGRKVVVTNKNINMSNQPKGIYIVKYAKGALKINI